MNSGIEIAGIGLGSMIAVVLSWDRNRSILWMIIHGWFSWLYVIHYILTDEKRALENRNMIAGVAITIAIILVLFLLSGLLSWIQRIS